MQSLLSKLRLENRLPLLISSIIKFYEGYGLSTVYCNDNWLVVSSIGTPTHFADLASIPQPPGGTDLPYAQSCVARSYHSQYYYFKIPLKPQLLPTSDTSNNLAAFLKQTDPAGM